MSNLDLPKTILDRVIARRGRIHVFEDLHPARTALLVVDMQNAYLDERGPGFVAAGRDISTNINGLAEALRSAGGAVIWLRNTLGRETLQSWETYGYFRSGEARERMLTALEKGSDGHEIWSGMDVKPSDLVVDKRRYSAFIPGSSHLKSRLRKRDVDTLLITGVLANVCCESTARDAMMMNYKVIMVSDGMAAHSDQELKSTLANALLVFGDVMTCNQVIGRLQSASLSLRPHVRLRSG